MLYKNDLKIQAYQVKKLNKEIFNNISEKIPTLQEEILKQIEGDIYSVLEDIVNKTISFCLLVVHKIIFLCYYIINIIKGY